MSKVAGLQHVAAFTRRVEAEFVAELPQQERLAPGALADWSAKDLVAHVTTWRERGTAELEAARRGEVEPEPQEFDEANRAIFAENHSLSWQDILSRAENSWTAFLETLAGLPEDLMTVSADGQPDRPIWRRITVEAGNHPCMHYAEFARRHGRVASASRWLEGVTPLLLNVDPSPEWQGVVHYNLACHYALSGLPEPALKSLKTSLDQNPSLREWSRRDPDLASLHSHRRFASIVGPES
jgi:hypothetical protein